MQSDVDEAQVPPQAQLTTLQACAELLEFRHLVFDSILHPLGALSAYTTFLPITMGGKTFAVSSMPNLANKVVLVTGGNTGLGYESIKALAGHGPAQIYLASRTESKATTAIADIQKTHPDVKISYLPLDLTSFASIRAAAETFQKESQRLDILMLNAGIMAVPPGQTKEGFEIQLGTNHFGHFLLTKLLLPTLEATSKLPDADVRVVSLTSEGHNFARSKPVLMSPSKLADCNAWGRYGYSKLANILFARSLAKRHPEILSVSVHPGLVSTDLYNSTQKNNMIMRVMLMFGGWVRVTAQQGALNQLWASVAPKSEVVNGAYYTPVGVKSSGNSLAADEKLAEEFWEWTEKEVEGKGY